MAEELELGEIETSEEGEVGVEEEEEDMESENHAVSEEEDAGDQHEFEIIDQVDSDEEGEGGGRSKESENDDGKGDDGDSSDTDLDDTQLHEMLEKGIDKDSITAKKTQDEEPTDGKPVIRNKIVLRDWENDPFDILPEGWVCCTHNSGMPVYLHKDSRVCTMARPYTLGNASTRRHDIPISAIPCLKYRQILKNLQKEPGALDVTGSQVAGEKTSPVEIENSNIVEGIPPPQQNCIPDQNQQQTPPHNKEDDDILPSADPGTCPHKMWMVAQDSSGKCPFQREPEELHTGKTNEISQVEPNSQLSTSHSNNNTCADNPHSPEGENIAVKYDSSTPLKFEAYDGGYYSIEVEAAKHSLCFQENDNRDKDISMTNDTSEKGSTFPDKVAKVEVVVVKDEKMLNGEVDQEQSVSAASVNVCEIKSADNPLADSSKNNIVLEETSTSVNSSELVTSNTSKMSSIKRKIEDLKRRDAKQMKLMDGTAEGTSPRNENNIAVNVYPKDPEERLRRHAAEVKILTAEQRAIDSLLDIDAVHDYCAKLFKFKTIVVKKYKTWRERRKHLLGKNRPSRPELPADTKLITCPIVGNNYMNGSSASIYKKKEFILNPSGKSYLCILHEYMQRTLKIQPTYVFKELENPKTPYGATVMINNIEYGTGLASSKKMAKQDAAKETLKILIPSLCNKISDQELKNTVTDLSFFDDIQVEDPRILDLGNKVGQPTPFQLLRECLRRNFGWGATECAVKTTALKNQKCEFTLTVGKHEATVVAKNKRDGKQQAAQCILAKLHPHVPSWGSLLRLYATNVEKPMEKVEEMNEIKTHVPNKAVLENLREEMRKLHKQKESIPVKGKMIISTKDLPSKMSCVDL